MDHLAPVRPASRLGGDRFSKLLPEFQRLVLSGGAEFTHRQRSPVGSATSMDTNGPLCRYWAWRFDRPDDPVGPEDFWGKSQAQAVADLEAASATDATLGPIHGPADVELVVDPYFPDTIGIVDPALKGRTIHAGGRCRGLLDGHTQFIRDTRTPLP